MSIAGLLFVLLVVLKLVGAISISWWWVFAPLWAGLLLTVFVVGILALITAVLQ